MAATPLLDLRHIAKRYPDGTQALVDASLSVGAGEVLGLLGANGAGKSTLVSILSGAQVATGGEMRWRGEPVRWRRPFEARRCGVSTLYQSIPLVPALSVLENLLLETGGFWRRDRQQRARAEAAMAMLGDDLPLDTPVGELPIGARQKVAIGQSLVGGADLIVMDEPTASLAADDRASVHRLIRRLAREQGKAIILVSHFLDEIQALTDRVTVLRDGRDAMHGETASLTEAGLAAAISGREVTKLARRPRPAEAVIRLSVRGLESPGRLKPTGFEARRGEIVGIAGMLGSGRSELLHAIFGADEAARGEVLVDDRPAGPTIAEAVAAGLALVPEDRKRQGYVADFSIAENIALPAPTGWRIDPEGERQRGEAAIAALSIRADSAARPVASLSGGNAQKVVLAKWLGPRTRVLLLDEPTAGIDVGARIDILEQVRRLAETGVTILLVSSDFSELLALSDRILVMRGGAVTASVDPAVTSEVDLTLLTSASAARPDGVCA